LQEKEQEGDLDEADKVEVDHLTDPKELFQDWD
jgi:hypothetical protein